MLNHDKTSSTLLKVIITDLLQYGKLSVFLLVLVVVTAISVVITTFYTRLLVAKREELILEHNILDIEWRNLILEENTLGDHIRIERIAKEKLNMQYIDPAQERVIINVDKGKSKIFNEIID